MKINKTMDNNNFEVVEIQNSKNEEHNLWNDKKAKKYWNILEKNI